MSAGPLLIEDILVRDRFLTDHTATMLGAALVFYGVPRVEALALVRFVLNLQQDLLGHPDIGLGGFVEGEE